MGGMDKYKEIQMKIYGWTGIEPGLLSGIATY